MRTVGGYCIGWLITREEDIRTRDRHIIGDRREGRENDRERGVEERERRIGEGHNHEQANRKP
jgi:hypothetical protein